MPKKFDLLFVTADHKLASSFLVEELSAEYVGEGDFNGQNGAIYMLPDKEGFDVIDGILGDNKEEVVIIDNDRNKMKAWFYE